MWNFERFDNNIAIIDECGEETTYAELRIASETLSSWVGKRSLVFNLCSNEKGSLLGYVAFLNAGIVPAMLDATLEKKLLLTLIEKYKPDFLWVPKQVAEEFPTYSKINSVWDYTLLRTTFDQAFPLYKDLALLLTTSGSTGSSKFVRQSYANIKANTEAIVEYLQLDETERPITTMPMSYTYGLSIINSHLWVGASIILTQKTLMHKEFWQQFKDNNATSFGGVPYTYEILNKLRFNRMDLPTLRTMTQAGGKLSSELQRAFAEYAHNNGKKFVVMYGQTEATARMSYLPTERALEKIDSIGLVIPGGEFYLIDAEGREIIEPETVGELVYKGMNVSLGYAESGNDLIAGDDLHCVLHTEDMAKRDPEGFYYIVGRKKRFLKIFGNRVSLDETEKLLNEAFPNLECACGGIDDKLITFITDGEMADQVVGFLTKTTGLNHAAFRIHVIDEVPRSKAGKILYSELSKFYDG